MNIPSVNFTNVNRIIHAYRVAPWRVQRQWLGSASVVVVVFAMVAALYLNIASRTAIAGREIQDLSDSITFSRQTSADLQTQLAKWTSAQSLEQRARKMGFRPMRPQEAEYVAVAGYVAKEAIDLSSAALPRLDAPAISPEYNQSLLDWMDRRLMTRSLYQ